MRKIAFLIESLRCGGAQKQLVILAKTLKKEGFDITILYFYPNGFFEPELKDSGIRLICLENADAGICLHSFGVLFII
jgi:hypothetical protein